jgi:glycosyltransferase involved in cell wall biosynthesis
MQDMSNLVNPSAEKSAYESQTKSSKVKLALFSSGLGIINRGFEISTARFFRALHDCEELDTRLYAGADYPDAEKVWCIGRNEWLRFPLNLLSFVEHGKVWRIAYALEQTSFCFGLIKHSREVWQPEVVWTKEVPLAHVLYEFRRISGIPYKIIFANGGGFRPRTYQQFDFIQHLHSEGYEEAARFGIPESKMNVLPNAIPYTAPSQSKAELRKQYGYSATDWIIICVAAWNTHHKRIDYLIEEVAAAQIPECQLVICGQPEPDAEDLKKLAQEKLGSRVRFITVSEDKVQELLHMSDLFVLCSINEAFGTVMVEAAMAGLPVLGHPHGGSKYILQDEQWMLDMLKPGNLAQRLREIRQKPFSKSDLNKLTTQVHDRFNEKTIASAFESMVKQVHETR